MTNPFWRWYETLLAGDQVPSWALNVDAAREVFAAMAPPPPKPEPPTPPRVPGCRLVRTNGIETISIPRRSRRMIHGVASTETISSNGNAYSMKGCKVVMPVPLLSRHHEHGRIGECVLIRKSDRQIYFQATFDNDRAADYAWEMMENGTIRGVSVGTKPLSQCVVEGVRFYGSWLLREISLVKVAGNPDCYCEPYRFGS